MIVSLENQNFKRTPKNTISFNTEKGATSTDDFAIIFDVAVKDQLNLNRNSRQLLGNLLSL